jgi:ribosomal protein L13E
MEEIEESKKYGVNIDPEDLVGIYIDKWVLKWCKEYHPEAFEAADKVIRGFLDENNEE